jgi:hypothetical protein
MSPISTSCAIASTRRAISARDSCWDFSAKAMFSRTVSGGYSE